MRKKNMSEGSLLIFQLMYFQPSPSWPLFSSYFAIDNYGSVIFLLGLQDVSISHCPSLSPSTMVLVS